jgi:HlyD family secretion protein
MANSDPTTSELDALLGEERDWRRYLPWGGGVAALIVVALGAYLLMSDGDSAPVVAPEAVEVTTGPITSTASLSGTADSARTVELSFPSAGSVTAVAVAVADEVREGDALATMDGADAERRLETTSIQLRQAQLRLDELTADPESADLAAAYQSIASARSQVASAEVSLGRLTDEPSTSEIESAEQAVANALVQVSNAEEALAAVSTGASSAELASAESSVSVAEAQVATASGRIASASDGYDRAQELYCSTGVGVSGSCSPAAPLSDTVRSRLQDSREGLSSNIVGLINSYLDADSEYLTAAADQQASAATLATAQERLDGLLSGATAEELFQAQQSLVAARSSYDGAVARLSDLMAGADDGEIGQSQASLGSAEASLASAQTRYAELVGGASGTEIEQQVQSVRLAEISVEEAQAAVDELTIRAPFDGVVGTVNVSVGDRVTANTVAMALSTPDEMRIALTVSEAEVFDLQPGQVGLATFSAIDGAQYPVRILSVSSIPNTSQGVVTYAVEAEILQGPQLAEVAEELQALAASESSDLGSFDFGSFGGGALTGVAPGGIGGATGGGRPTDGAGGAGTPGGRGDGGGRPGGAGGFGDALGGIELPEGVTMRDVLQALAAGEPVPDGVVLPDGFELPQGFGGGAPNIVAANQQLPLAGMSASVQVLLEVREDVLLAPTTAIRQQGSSSYVVIEGEDGEFERLTVVTGESDGSRVEIVSGLAAGDTIYIGASAPASGDFSLSNVDTEQPSDQQAPFGGGIFRAGPGGGPQ